MIKTDQDSKKTAHCGTLVRYLYQRFGLIWKISMEKLILQVATTTSLYQPVPPSSPCSAWLFRWVGIFATIGDSWLQTQWTTGVRASDLANVAFVKFFFSCFSALLLIGYHFTYCDMISYIISQNQSLVKLLENVVEKGMTILGGGENLENVVFMRTSWVNI